MKSGAVLGDTNIESADGVKTDEPYSQSVKFSTLAELSVTLSTCLSSSFY